MSILSKFVMTTQEPSPASELNRGSLQATVSAFVAFFCIVGMAGAAAAAALPKGPKLV